MLLSKTEEKISKHSKLQPDVFSGDRNAFCLKNVMRDPFVYYEPSTIRSIKRWYVENVNQWRQMDNRFLQERGANEHAKLVRFDENFLFKEMIIAWRKLTSFSMMNGICSSTRFNAFSIR